MNYLVVDVGGTAIKHAMMNERYEMWDKGTAEDLPDSHNEFVELIAKLYRAAGSPEGGIAMSYCGVVDPETGYVSFGGTHHFNAGHNFRDELRELCGASLSIHNDGWCGATGELAQGALEGCKNALVFVIGTALGGCAILDSKVHVGSHGVQSAFLTMSNNLDSDISTITDYATAPTANTYLKSSALAEGYAEMRGADWVGRLPRNGKEFFVLVDSGDEVALSVLRRYCRRFAQLIWSLQVPLDVERVAIGGGISAAPALLATLQEEVDRAFNTELAHMIGVVKPEVVRCKHGNDANLIGALANKLG